MSFPDNVKELAERIAAEFRAYLPRSGGKVDGDVEVTGSLKATATHATHDANGNVIADTYAPKSALAGFAESSHASATGEHGIGSSSSYGHNRLSDAVDSSLGEADGTAATPLAVKAAYDKASTAANTAEDAQLSSDNAYAGCEVEGSTLIFTRNDGTTEQVVTPFVSSAASTLSAEEVPVPVPVTAGTVVDVPRYVVGSCTIAVYVDGARATRGGLFSEVGEAGAVSTTVRINDDIDASHEVMACSDIVVSTGTAAVGSVSVTEAAIATPVVSGENVSVPAYIVGARSINIYVDGVLCQRGSDFVEVGSAGAESSTIKFTSSISGDYEVLAVAG